MCVCSCSFCAACCVTSARRTACVVFIRRGARPVSYTRSRKSLYRSAVVTYVVCSPSTCSSFTWHDNLYYACAQTIEHRTHTHTQTLEHKWFMVLRTLPAFCERAPACCSCSVYVGCVLARVCAICSRLFATCRPAASRTSP